MSTRMDDFIRLAHIASLLLFTLTVILMSKRLTLLEKAVFASNEATVQLISILTGIKADAPDDTGV